MQYSQSELDDLVDDFDRLPIHDEEADRPDRAFALSLADHLGYEGAQRLYHFAVLVTKLA